METNGYYPYKILNKGELGNRNNSSQLEVIIKLLMYCPAFAEFSEKNGPENYDLPYMLLGGLIKFISDLFEKKNIEEISRIFTYLDELSYHEDKDVIDLLCSGCLEVFDNYPDILPELVRLMPANLKALFLKHFGRYLEIAPPS